MFKLVRLQVASAYKVTATVYDALSVGRGRQSDLCASDRLISANHARLFIRDGALQVVDLDSRNGTEVNGRRLAAHVPQALSPGDVIDFAGRLSFRVDTEGDETYPVIQVEQDVAPDASEGIVRRLSPHDGEVSVSAALASALGELMVALTAPALLADGERWLAALSAGVRDLLGVEEVWTLRLLGHEVERLWPPRPRQPLRPQPLDELWRGGRALGVELLAAEGEVVNDSRTVDTSSAVVRVVSVLVGEVRSAAGRWGALYATSAPEVRRRPLEAQDLWLLERVCALVGHLLPQLSLGQLLADPGARYEALLGAADDLGLVGSSPVLGAAHEAVLNLAHDPAPVLLLAPEASLPERWVRLLHRLGRSAASPLRVLAVGNDGSLAPRQHARLIEAVGEGTLWLRGLESLDPEAAPHLEALLDAAWTSGARVVLSSAAAVEVLQAGGVLSARLRARHPLRVLRPPRLDERPEDLPTLVRHRARALDPLRSAEPLSINTLGYLSRLIYPDDLDQLERELTVYLTEHDARPLPREALPDLDARLRPLDAPPLQPPPRQRGVHPLAPDPLPGQASVALGLLGDQAHRAGLLQAPRPRPTPVDGETTASRLGGDVTPPPRWR